MNRSGPRPGTGLRDRLPPPLRRLLARSVQAVLGPLRRLEASRLPRGLVRPSRDALASFEAYLEGVAEVQVVRVSEPTPVLRSPRPDDLPPHRPIDNVYVVVDAASGALSLRNNHVIGPGRCIVSESKAPFGALPISLTRLERARPLPGTVAFLSNGWVDNYYHWMCFTLPNLRILDQVLGGRPDHVYVGRPLTAWHLETLAAVGIDAPRVATEGTVAERVVAVLPDRAGALDGAAIEFVRRSFLPGDGGVIPRRRLFVRRGRTRHRRLLNAAACEALLREKHGFEVVTMDGMTVAEQAATFASAALVVAPHGAALTNLMFASPAARVIELVPHEPDSLEFSYFAELCAHVGCEYLRLRGLPAAGGGRRANLQDIRVDVAALDEAVAAFAERP